MVFYMKKRYGRKNEAKWNKNRKTDEKEEQGGIKHNAELCAHIVLLTFFNRRCVCVISYGSPYEKKDMGERSKKTDVKRSGNRKIDEKQQKGRTILCTQCTTQNLAHITHF